MIGTSVALLDQMVSRVGAGLTAQMTDAVVAGDDEGRQFAPCLGSIGAVYRVTPHALGGAPTERAMKGRFPGHIPSAPLLSLWIQHAEAVVSEAIGLLG